MYDIEERRMKGSLRDWRKALRTPATYRVGNTVRIQSQFVLLVIFVGGILLLFFYCNWWTLRQNTPVHKWTKLVRPYNSTYPLTPPVKSGTTVSFKIGVVADSDTNSKSKRNPYVFESYFRKGTLIYDEAKNTVSFSWDESNVLLSSAYSNKGRGMELSDLIVYDGRLLTFDDRSGVVFEIINKRVVPWVILVDGNGYAEKAFKAEWATIKDEILYVGSMGKEWTSSKGEFQSYDPMWVKAINSGGQVQHLNWVEPYKAIRNAIGIKWPGYMIHESAVWSEHNKKWYFLPRRCSHETYNETKDENMGCNYLITADEDFKHVNAVEVQHLNWVEPYKAIRNAIGIKWPGYMIHESAVWSEHNKKWYFLPRRCSHETYNETKDENMGCNYLITADEDFKHVNAVEIAKFKPKLGFSSFKFIPGTKDTAIVALKTIEFEGKTSTYISAFNIDGTILLADTLIDSNLKYEGVEFI